MMLNKELKQTIQRAYSQFLEQQSLKPRYGQKLMIAEIAKSLAAVQVDDEGNRESDPAVCAVEAGTGTGKTVAYAVAAIPIAQYSEKTLIVSTATVALQEQIVLKDLPQIRQQSGLSFNFCLAKGRGRYVCLTKLDHQVQSADDMQSTVELFAEVGYKVDLDNSKQPIFQDMLNRLATGKWDGDRDNWLQPVDDEVWRAVTTDHHQCTNRRCEFFNQCAFFKAREALGKVDVVVTNHDLVLADLALGGGAVLPAPKDAIYIFDEGHHLPDKAVNHFSHGARIKATGQWLDSLAKQLSKWLQQHALPGEIGRLMEKAGLLAPELQKLLDESYQLLAQLLTQQTANNQASSGYQKNKPTAGSQQQELTINYRFPMGVIPELLKTQAEQLKQQFSQLTDVLDQVAELLKEAIDGKLTGVDKQEAEQWYPLVGVHLTRSMANLALWQSYAATDPTTSPPWARWLVGIDIGGRLEVEIASSPILAAETLRQSLWNRAHAAVITSATLTALGTFDRFRMRAGIPKNSATLVVPSPFDYATAGQLVVPAMKSGPKDQQGHTEEIIQQLPALVSKYSGNLVLFASRKQMLAVYYGLAEKDRRLVMMQGDLAKHEIIKRHKQAIDKKQPSVIFGLASFAEGIDLPGEYCQHVIIAKIPFATPDDPIESALAEWIENQGRNAFMEITIPDAAVKLVQACGRLLRTEADHGQVTLLDRRLVTQRYGAMLLNSLPPFMRVIE
ncbi:ATP-dependent DNA helicase DinG [Spartinivicinus marinus]|nr:ATP-dependent DNA helicase DinG [Spartinivicinus marinus]MCX4028518.1 ATP-dependent DNA helicase DinG [Spartinivicinus marinus]